MRHIELHESEYEAILLALGYATGAAHGKKEESLAGTFLWAYGWPEGGLMEKEERAFYLAQEEKRDRIRFWTNVVEIAFEDSNPVTDSIRMADRCLEEYEKRFSGNRQAALGGLPPWGYAAGSGSSPSRFRDKDTGGGKDE
jgi:hypothetical protein